MIQNTLNLDYVNESKNVLQQEVKEENLGQWSARKAQMVAAAYKKAGGGYKGGKGKKQKDLKRWGKEKWMTRKEYEKKKK